jgi:Domain of unknown function (DUF4287)
MSFKAYIINIKEKTGKTLEDFKQLAEANGFLHDGQLKTGVKAGDIVAGHGHAMAIYALFKGAKNENSA